MNSGWKKMFKFLTESVNDTRIQDHISESIEKFESPKASRARIQPRSKKKKN